MVCYLNVAVQSIFTLRPSVSEFSSSLGLVTSAGHAASSYMYLLSSKYLTPTKGNTASSPSALTSLSLCSLTRRHTHSETEEGTNTPTSASTLKHAHTALISANCWRWVLLCFKGKQTGIERGSRWEEESTESKADAGIKKKGGSMNDCLHQESVESVKHASSDRKDGGNVNRSLLWTWEEKHSDSCVGGRCLSHFEFRMEPEESVKCVALSCVMFILCKEE